MADDNHHLAFLDPIRRYVPLIAWTISLAVVLFIPLKIIGYGYLPGDDALRHAAKAVSGKSWSEILILSPVYQMDHEYGWNWLLTALHRLENWDAEKLVIFSVVSMFVLVNLAGLAWLKRPEAWLATMLASMILGLIPMRFTLGRPYLITLASLITVLYLWRVCREKPPRKPALALMIGLAAISTFFHGPWYLWVLPITAFFLAGEFRWGIALGICWGIGVIIGSVLTGHPIEYPLQALRLAFLAVGAHETQRTMASELQPFTGDYWALMAVGSLLVLRALAKLNSVPLTRDPAFWLACMTWILAFKVARFWSDWGWPALMVMIAWDLQLFMETRQAADSPRRLVLVGILGLAAYLGITCDFNSRWTGALSQQYLTEDNPDLAGWMPDKGGIFYTADMSLFYQTFYKNPNGDWRYMLGFEPTWMPKEDFDVYHKILWNYNDGKAYKPWVDQMTSADRLAVRGGGGGAPDVEGLEWKYGVSGIWIGRLPRTTSVAVPSTTK
jgi:hypothetical protein